MTLKEELPTPAEKDTLTWTATYARPEASWWTSPIRLDYAQQEWDAAEVQRQKHVAVVEGIRARREAQKAEQRAVQEAAAQERRERLDVPIVAELRSAYLAADPTATEEQFQAVLPELREERRRRAALAGNDAARVAFTRHYRG